jgi:hypothetical protein
MQLTTGIGGKSPRNERSPPPRPSGSGLLYVADESQDNDPRHKG